MRAGGVPGWLLTLAMLGLGAFVVWWYFHMAATLLRGWADENGYTVLRRQHRHLRKGPFLWASTKNQAVYRVTVQDKAGHVLEGWVKCGSPWFGVFTSVVEVLWDEPGG